MYKYLKGLLSSICFFYVDFLFVLYVPSSVKNSLIEPRIGYIILFLRLCFRNIYVLEIFARSLQIVRLYSVKIACKQETNLLFCQQKLLFELFAKSTYHFNQN